MNWLIAISPTAIFALILWLCRNLIVTRLTKSVQHEFDGKIEVLKSDLRVKESQIESIKSGALSNLAQRQLLLFERKIKASETLWKAVDNLSQIKNASYFMRNINFEEAAKIAPRDQNVQQFFNILPFKNLSENLPKSIAHKCRPFVSPMSWAYFSAYQAIIFDAVVRLLFLQKGLNTPELINTNHCIKLVEIALPHHIDAIKKHGVSYTYFLLEELETKILEEIRRTLNGAEDDQEALSKAANITKAADELMAEAQKERSN